MTNALTEHYGIPKVNPAHDVKDDVIPLGIAFDMVDLVLFTLAQGLLTKAATDHDHAMGDVTGLIDALAGKMAATRTFELAELTDVVGADDAINNYVLVKIDGDYVFRSALSVLDEHSHTMAQVSGLTAALALLATKADAVLTGNPTAPTQATGNSSTRLATTAFVANAVAALVNSSPTALDTLQELAAALGNDANFATTVNNQLALKAPKASPELTGDIYLNGRARGNKSAATGTFDCSLSNFFTISVSANTTFTATNVPAGSFAFTVKMAYTSGVITLPSGVKYADGKIPNYVAGTWYLIFMTDDGGATWELTARRFA